MPTEILLVRWCHFCSEGGEILLSDRALILPVNKTHVLNYHDTVILSNRITRDCGEFYM